MSGWFRYDTEWVPEEPGSPYGDLVCVVRQVKAGFPTREILRVGMGGNGDMVCQTTDAVLDLPMRLVIQLRDRAEAMVLGAPVPQVAG